jgi:hypothetical protein
MAQQTAVEWLMATMKKVDVMDWDLVFIQAKEMEKERIINAMMYALDEDGHTGDWKIKFVNDYYDKTFKS